MSFHVINGRIYEERDGAFHPVNRMETTNVADYVELNRPQSSPATSGYDRGFPFSESLESEGAAREQPLFATNTLSSIPAFQRNPAFSTVLPSAGSRMNGQIDPGAGVYSLSPLRSSRIAADLGRGAVGPTSKMRFDRMVADAPRLGVPMGRQDTDGASLGNRIADMIVGLTSAPGDISAGRTGPAASTTGKPPALDGNGYAPTGKLPLSDATLASLLAGAATESQPFMGVTAAQIRKIMPGAGGLADQFVDPINAAMEANGIRLPTQQAAFLAHISDESDDLKGLSEYLRYSAQGLVKTWPKHFPNTKMAQQYVGKPEAIANHAYANRNGNGDEASGDGFRFRGGGLMQTTGRDNYRAVGFENDPDALRTPAVAANTAAQYWAQHNLNKPTTSQLDRHHFDATTRRINGGQNGADRRWAAYQRALAALGNH